MMQKILLTTLLIIATTLAGRAQDICSGAIPISCGNVISGNTSSYTADVAPFCGTSDGTGGGLWYKSTATCTSMTVSLCGSSFDTKLRVYSGNCAGLVCVTGIDDFCGLQSEVSWASTPGVTYYILVHGYGGATGAYTLSLTCTGCCATNPPTADFSVPTSVCAGSTAAFSDISSCNPTSWSWSFPGGTPATSTAQNPVVTYSTAGTYSVTLTATNAFGSDVEVKTNYITVLDCAGACMGNYYYIRSNTTVPWGSNSNEIAMDAVYGAGVWTQAYFETVNVGTLFSAATCFIFLEGSDAGATELETFLNANMTALQNWVAAGGRLFVNAAPNEDNGMSYGFGGTLMNFASNYNGTGTAMVPGHPIFNGPFLPVGNVWTGNYFSHGNVTGGGTTLIQDAGMVQAAEKAWGGGIAIFGSMTTANWHSPALEGQNLRQNILCYLAPPPICGTPLPIELISFGGAALDEVNILDWSTATEVNCDFFTLERSADGSDFDQLMIIDGAGNSNSVIAYSVRDEHPYKGVSYYRLKQTDFNGEFKYSSIIALNNAYPVNIYPNPATETITIALTDEPAEVIEVTIRNTVGQIQTVQLLSQKEVINISGLPSGVYLVELIIDGKKSIHKFTKK